MALDAYRRFCQTRQDAGLWRTLRDVDPLQNGHVRLSGRLLVNFSSNNYMGLSSHPDLIERARTWTERWGTGAGASRLVSGNLSLFSRIENKLIRGKGCEAALIFSAGFQANTTLLSALLDRQILGQVPQVFSDRLNHASLHHGCKAAGVRQLRYRHNDLNHLESLLQKRAQRDGPRFILSETVFSMDGDRCDIDGLIYLKKRYGAVLYLDEAHATGVLGPGGFGLSSAYPGQVEVVMGTFGKGLGGFGAYVACSAAIRDYLINRCAGLIYTTALPPAVLGAMDAALDLLPSLQKARDRLQRQSAMVRDAWRAVGLDTGASTTHIIPLKLKGETAAVDLSHRLEHEGMLAVAIRPPTVPPGGSRVRFSLTAQHSDRELRTLTEAVIRLTSH